MCGDGTNDVGALRQSQCGIALISEIQEEFMNEEDRKKKKFEKEKKREEARKIASQNYVPDPRLGFREQLDKMRKHYKRQAEAANFDDDIQPVKLGDASIAAPFTSRVPNISAVLKVVRQGRCTLVTTLQMYQILALNCLISAYRFVDLENKLLSNFFSHTEKLRKYLKSQFQNIFHGCWYDYRKFFFQKKSFM